MTTVLAPLPPTFTATRDTDVGGTRVAAGQKVVMYYGAANRDPDAFGPTAGELDLSRSPNEHVAFGGGGPRGSRRGG